MDRLKAAVLFLAIPLAIRAQAADGVQPKAGSITEERFLDRCAKRTAIPISVRPFSLRALDTLRATCMERDSARFWRAAPAWITVAVNSTRAGAYASGPVWQGRGLTVGGSAGFEGQWRRASWSLRPIGFWSQNLPYSPSRTIEKQLGDFTSPWMPAIDLPYRFGDRGYARLDLGDSYLRLDSRWLATGISTAAQVWGPARHQPLVLGNSAGGFPHVFVETGLPINVGIGTVAGRWIVGQIRASSFGRPHGGTSTRLGVGAVATFVPRGLGGMEVGGARFFHLYDTPEVRDLTTYTLPLSGLFKSGLGDLEAGSRTYNQLASAFLRIAPRTSNIETYAEFLRDDHSVDFRDAMVELDHNSAFMVGFRRTSERNGRCAALTVEVSNGRLTHLFRVRSQSPVYTHDPIVEGHTLYGLPLGAPAVVGGGGLIAVWDRADVNGAWTYGAAVTHRAQTVEGGTWNGKPTGDFAFWLRREVQRQRLRWSGEVRLEPGFGDVKGTNIGLIAAVHR